MLQTGWRARLSNFVGVALKWLVLALFLGVFAPEKGLAEILWSAGHENGTGLTEWGNGSGASGGGFFNSGAFTVATSTTKAHSGLRSMKTTINTSAGESAVRAFRWKEAQTGQALYYSVWAYWPQRSVPEVFWNIMQFKSTLYNASGIQIKNDPIITISVNNKGANGAMRLYAFYFRSFFGGQDLKIEQALKDLPVARWIHLEAFLRQSAGTTGAFQLWQDGARILNLQNLKTRYTDGDNQGSVNNYSGGLSPDLATIYFDDAAISTVRLGP